MNEWKHLQDAAWWWC